MTQTKDQMIETFVQETEVLSPISKNQISYANADIETRKKMKITKIDRTSILLKNTVSSLDINKVSKSYEHELSNIDNVVRVDLPNTYSSIITQENQNTFY